MAEATPQNATKETEKENLYLIQLKVLSLESLVIRSLLFITPALALILFLSTILDT